MDLDSSSESEARIKQRRIRTTLSCINCHTSKRKCDRKRPCSRCVSLGLTGLCVYEMDDLTARDDPNADELTHCRGRIAELEAVIRELRGRPHPRWADTDGRRVSRFKTLARTDPFEGLTSLSDSSNDSSESPHMKIEDFEGIDPSFTVGPSRVYASASPSTFHVHSTDSPTSAVSYLPSPVADIASPAAPSYFRLYQDPTLTQHSIMVPAAGCHCTSMASSALDSLSLELQRATDALSLHHTNVDTCQLFRMASELRDALTSLTPLPTTASHYPYNPRLRTTSSESSLAHALSYPPGAPAHHPYDTRLRGLQTMSQPRQVTSTPPSFRPDENWYHSQPPPHPHTSGQHTLHSIYSSSPVSHVSP